MTIAIDIDGTFDRDPLFWQTIMHHARLSGHDVIVVTGAKQPADKLTRLGIPANVPVLVSAGEFKRGTAQRHGYSVDIWIDNEPGTIEPAKILASANNDSL